MSSSGNVSHTIALDSLTVPENWMIGPRSFLVDRVVPGLERVRLPSVQTGGGEVVITEGEHLFAPPECSWRRQILQSLSPGTPETLSPAQYVLDLRVHSPENWAHFLNIHMALVALVCRTTGKHWRDFTLLLPLKTPGYIRSLSEFLGITCVYTSSPVRAWGARLAIEDMNVIRGERFALLNTPDLCPVADAFRSGLIPEQETPKRIFIARKDSRKLSNQDAVMDLLGPLGFTCVYPEELGVPGQLRTLSQAEQIVAVHGAGLAPMAFHRPDRPPVQLVELFPVGHITNCYRAFSAVMQAPWCGVRGHIPPGALREIYKLDQGAYTKHSLDDFTVDVASVEAALEIVAGAHHA